tara:strand:+ start:34 stop:702 length:669 start_codon:yes stop_codon:yes gene_type:complete
MIRFKTIKKKFKSIKGNSLAEFAVTTAMMATLATTAAPRFSGIGEGAKEKKTLSEIDKIVIASSNFFNNKVTTEGRGRFPGQEKYDVQIGGYASEIQLLTVIGDDAAEETSFNGYDNAEGSNWRSIFGTNDASAGISDGSNVVNDDGSLIGHDEFLAEFANNAIKSPYQDGHYIYIVLPGGVDYVDPDGDGTYVKVDCNDCSPILYVADNEDPSKLFKKYQP